MSHSFARQAPAAAFLFLAWAVHAQESASPPSGSQGSLPAVTITGNPLGGDNPIAPAAVLQGNELLLRSASTIGETLATTPGVSSSYFGPNASRPIVRGLDGDRVRVLNNGGATLDASGLSFDHAVPAEPITVERIEVLRGPAALLYGASAIGGVVNIIDNRIPSEPQKGVVGKVDLGLASGNREHRGAALVEAGNGAVGLHMDLFGRETGDVRVPVDLACTQGGTTRVRQRICNSASDAHGGAIGGSVFFDRGYLGASASTYRTSYGTVAEDEVTVGMKSNRYALEGELRLDGWLQNLKAKLAHTDYRHTEFEAGVPGTRFTNGGDDVRFEARHARLGPLEGTIGFQGEYTRFSAVGAEAFAPFSRTGQSALFLYEEAARSWGKLSFGGRLESVSVESRGNPAAPRFVPGKRAFTPASLSLGGLVDLSPAWQLTSNLAYSERAPRDYELFADGPHIATNTYELGDRSAREERSVNLDLGAQWKSGANSFKASVFATRFRDYLLLQRTGVDRDTDGNGGAGASVNDCGDGTSVESGCTAEILPEFAYRQVRARFVGFETGGTVRVWQGASKVDLELRGDYVRATNLDSGEALPRIPPLRFGATLVWAMGPLGARLGFDRATRQRRVPAGDTGTSGYTLWNAALTYSTKAGPADLLWFAKLDNATDEKAYSATSILTQTAPGRAPLPGRSLRLGLRAVF